MKKLAFIYTWPNTPFKNAEYEVLKRVEIAAKNIGIHLDIISSNGFILNDEYYETKNRINEDDYEFMVSVHYDDIKKLDIFSYYTLWVPPEISLQYDVYPQIKKNIISNDDYLIYDDGGQSDHLKTILIDSPRNLQNCSELYATPPVSTCLEPNLSNPHLFYCGINWEKLIGIKPRHAKLFSLLEKCEWVNIYGPEKCWKGCNRFKGTIPFDGISVIKEINKSGVCLSISSDVHYRAGSVTNRIYEGVAAGAVIISDTNRFVKKIFGDSVLYFDYDKTHPELMFNQIKEHMQWIKDNPQKAIKLATLSQKIFKENLGQEKQLLNLIANHQSRVKQVESCLFAKNEAEVIAILFIDDYVYSDSVSSTLLKVIANVSRQIHCRITLTVFVNSNFKNNIELLKLNNNKITIVYVNFYDSFGNKILTRGQVLSQYLSKEKFDYFILLSGNEYLFKDHITTLQRILEENNDSDIAYCGMNYVDSNGKFGYTRFEVLNQAKLFNIYNYVPNATFLLSSKVKSLVPSFVFSNVDGLELYTFVQVYLNKFKGKLSFSKRVTIRFFESYDLFKNAALKLNEQKNQIDGLCVFEKEESEQTSSDCFATDAVSEIYKNSGLQKYLLKRYKTHLKIDIVIKKIQKFFSFSNKRLMRNEALQNYKKARRYIKDLLRNRIKN